MREKILHLIQPRLELQNYRRTDDGVGVAEVRSTDPCRER